MDEPVVEKSEKTENAPENVEKSPEPEAEKAPVKIGRPKGAKDAKPRATPKRAPKIREEPLATPEPEPAAPEPAAPEPAAPAKEEPQAPQPQEHRPMSPRTLLREAASLSSRFHLARGEAKRSYWDAHFDRTLRPAF